MPMPQERTYTSEDYWNLPEGQRAELIDGKLYAMAPPNRIHQRLVSRLTQTLGAANDRVWVEPDISVICDKNKLSDRGCEGAPDWIIEIVSPTNPKNDYTIKLFKYRTAGVREYWIVNPMKKVVQTYVFEGIEESDVYLFEDEIPVYLFDGLTITISDLL